MKMGTYATELFVYADEVRELLGPNDGCQPTEHGATFPGVDAEWCETNCYDGDGTLSPSCDPTEDASLCQCRAGGVDFASLDSALQKFEAAALELDAAAGALNMVAGVNGTHSEIDVAAVNNCLQKVEQQFLDDAGLPDRPFFKNVVIAPGLNTGYAPEVFPALMQAVRDGQHSDAQIYLEVIANHITKAANFMQSTLQQLQAA
jgi:hypothetical protein